MRVAVAVTLLAMLFTAGPAAARGAGKPRPAPADPGEVSAGEIGDELERIVRKAGDWDGSVLVASGGAILLARGYGIADPDTGAPATTSTIYDLGHLSKWVTTTMILRLADLGMLSIDDPVATHFPEASGGLPGTTIRLLMAETAGIQVRFPADAFPQDRAHDRAWAVRQASLIQPVVRAGAIRVHSTPCWLLAVLCAENASGQRFGELLAELVFLPMGMHDTGACGDSRLDASRAAQRAMDSTRTREHLSCAEDDAGYATRGSNGVAGTVLDLFRFRTVLGDGDLLSRESHEAMWLANGQQRGLGIDVARGQRYASLTAVSTGCSQYYSYVPEGDYLVVMLARGRVELAAVGGALMEHARQQASADAGREIVAAVAGLAGEYAHPDLGRLGITVDGGLPAVCAWDQPVADRLFVTAKDARKVAKRNATRAKTVSDLLEALAADDEKRLAKLLKVKKGDPTLDRTRAVWGQVAGDAGADLARVDAKVDAIHTVERAGAPITTLRLGGETRPALALTWTKKQPRALTATGPRPLLAGRLTRTGGGWWRVATPEGDVYLHPGVDPGAAQHLWWYEAGDESPAACPRVGAEDEPPGEPPPPPADGGR